MSSGAAATEQQVLPTHKTGKVAGKILRCICSVLYGAYAIHGHEVLDELSDLGLWIGVSACALGCRGQNGVDRDAAMANFFC